MPTLFSRADLTRLRGDAKALRRCNPSLTQTQALDLVARREGWANWALLARNAEPLSTEEALRLSLMPFSGGGCGMFILQLAVHDRATREVLERASGLSFELPEVPPRWIVRRFTEFHASAPDPYLDRRGAAPRGRFVNGQFLCIVSINGVQPDEAEAEINLQLRPLAARFRFAAHAALASLSEGSAGEAAVRLFFSVKNVDGVESLRDSPYATVEAAMGAKLGEGAHPVAVATHDGWWTYQLQFGWTHLGSFA